MECIQIDERPFLHPYEIWFYQWSHLEFKRSASLHRQWRLRNLKIKPNRWDKEPTCKKLRLQALKLSPLRKVVRNSWGLLWDLRIYRAAPIEKHNLEFFMIKTWNKMRKFINKTLFIEESMIWKQINSVLIYIFSFNFDFLLTFYIFDNQFSVF